MSPRVAPLPAPRASGAEREPAPVDPPPPAAIAAPDAIGAAARADLAAALAAKREALELLERCDQVTAERQAQRERALAKRVEFEEEIRRLEEPLRAWAQRPDGEYPTLTKEAREAIAAANFDLIALTTAIATIDSQLGERQEQRAEVVRSVGRCEAAIQEAATELLAHQAHEAVEAYEAVVAAAIAAIIPARRHYHAIDALLAERQWDRARAPNGAFENGMRAQALFSRFQAASVRLNTALAGGTPLPQFERLVSAVRAEFEALVRGDAA